MQTVLVEITNSKALKLLEELEGLHLIRLLNKHLQPKQENLADKFGGKLNLSDQEYKDFQQHIAQSRNEWDQDI